MIEHHALVKALPVQSYQLGTATPVEGRIEIRRGDPECIGIDTHQGRAIVLEQRIAVIDVSFARCLLGQREDMDWNLGLCTKLQYASQRKEDDDTRTWLIEVAEMISPSIHSQIG